MSETKRKVDLYDSDLSRLGIIKINDKKKSYAEVVRMLIENYLKHKDC